MKKKYLLLLLLLTTVLWQSCLKDNFDFDKLAKTQWNPHIAVPLIYSTLTIQDILTKGDKEGKIEVGADQFCTLIYQGQLFSLRASEFLIFGDQSFNQSVALNTTQVASLVTGGTVTAQFSQVVNFNTGGTTEVDSMGFKTGNLNISLMSDFEYSGQLKISIPGAKLNGVAFTSTVPFTFSGSVPVTGLGNFNLSGYTFDMTRNGATSNQFVVNYEVTFTSPSGSNATGLNQMQITAGMNNISFNKIFGYFGQHNISPNTDTVLVRIFNNSFGGGSFMLVDPKVKLQITNSFGLPIQAGFSTFDGYNPHTATYPLNISAIPNPFLIAYPSITEVGQGKKTQFVLDTNTSAGAGGIRYFINKQPKYVIYKLNSQSNPAGKTSQNFALDTSHFKVDLEIEMPLYGSAKDFSLQDTLEFKFREVSNIESLLLRTYVSNGFPIEVKMQIYFTDSLYNKVDSLIAGNQVILPSPVLNSSGKVIAPSEKTIDVTYDLSRVENLIKARKMLIKASANTPNGGSFSTPVKFYADYKLDVKMGMQTKLNVKL